MDPLSFAVLASLCVPAAREVPLGSAHVEKEYVQTASGDWVKTEYPYEWYFLLPGKKRYQVRTRSPLRAPESGSEPLTNAILCDPVS